MSSVALGADDISLTAVAASKSAAASANVWLRAAWPDQTRIIHLLCR